MNKYKKIHLHCKLQSFVVEVKKNICCSACWKKNNFLGRNTVAWGSKAQQMIWFTRWMRFGDFILNLKVQLVQIKKKISTLTSPLNCKRRDFHKKNTDRGRHTHTHNLVWWHGKKTYFCRWLNFSLIYLCTVWLSSRASIEKIIIFMSSVDGETGVRTHLFSAARTFGSLLSGLTIGRWWEYYYFFRYLLYY